MVERMTLLTIEYDSVFVTLVKIRLDRSKLLVGSLLSHYLLSYSLLLQAIQSCPTMHTSFLLAHGPH